MTSHKNNLFDLGRIVATPGAIDALETTGVLPISLICRHQYGDWGDLCDEDKTVNDEAVHRGSRIFSSYQITPLVNIWVITEANRWITTLLLPSEY